MDIARADVTRNLEEAERMLDLVPKGTDIAVLPELFTTGFIDEEIKDEGLGEEDTPRVRKFLLDQAHKRNLAISGSFLALENQHLYNRGFFAEPNGDFAIYDKRHLFTKSGEDVVFSPGTKQSPVVRFRSWNIALAICYDVRFPAWNRNTNLKYDILIVPANWPDRRKFAWEHLLQARAIENQAYIVGANRGGEDKYGSYDDLTFIFDFMGQSIGSFEGSIVNGEFSHTLIDEFRERFAFWRDADKISIDI